MTEEERLKLESKIEHAIAICEDKVLLDLLVSILLEVKKAS